MSDAIKRLSEAIEENNEIIAEANNLIKEMKGIKEINDDTIMKYKKETDILITDLDDIIEVMEVCKQEDDPTLKAFDSKRKTAKSNSDKSKKQLTDALLKLESTAKKQKETELKKTKSILKNPSKKDDEAVVKNTSKKDKKKDPDAQSIKSAAGSSVVEDLEDVEDDQDKEFDKEKGDKGFKDNSESPKKENKKDKKTGKDKKKDEDENIHDDTKEPNKKGVKEKDKGKVIEGSEDGSVGGDEDVKKKSLKSSKLKGLKLRKGDNSKSKQTPDDGKGKNISMTNEDSMDEDNDEDMANKNKISNVTESAKDKNHDSLNKTMKVQSKKKDDDEIDDYKGKDSGKEVKSKKKEKDEDEIDAHEGKDSGKEGKNKKKKKEVDEVEDHEGKDTEKEGKSKKKKKDEDEIDEHDRKDSGKEGKNKKKKKDEDEIQDHEGKDIGKEGKSKKKNKNEDEIDDYEGKDSGKESKNKKKKKDEDGIVEHEDEEFGKEGKNKKNKTKVDTQKKDKQSKDNKSEDTQSIPDINDDSLRPDKGKDREKKNKDKKDKDTDSSIKKDSKNSEGSKNKGKAEESDKNVKSPSIQTQESIKSESDFYDDFESDDEDKSKEEVVMRKSAPKQSSMPESQTKPTSSLQRQHVIESPYAGTSSTIGMEGELTASTTFENIEGFYVVTKDVSAVGEDDLSVHDGEHLTILEINDDGWWLAKNSQGEEGFVPVSCLKPVRDSKELLRSSDKMPDVQDETIVQKSAKIEMKEAPDESDRNSTIRGSQLWNEITQTMKEKGLNDVLKSFGSLPTGFRFGTLASWYNKHPVECSMRADLCPKLSESDLSFRDLQYDYVENKIRPRPVRIQRIVQIVKSFQMVPTSDKFVVKSRHIRLCLFNGEKAISNIHLMRASVNDRDPKIWNFNGKIMDSTNSLDFNEIFLRTNHSSTEISLLLEFCMLGFKSKSTTTTSTEVENAPRKSTIVKINEEFNDDELVEFSCGWTKIPLYDENGQLITSKNADYELFGGTPYEEGLEVDPNNPRTATGSRLKLTNQGNKQPQVSVRISLPGKETKDLLESLPDVIIGSTLHLTTLSFYRRILCEQLMDKRQNLTSAEPIYSPFLVSFLEIADQSDVLDVLRTIWNEKMKTLKNLDKKDYGKMNKIYQDVYMENIYPLTKITSLHKSSLARQDNEQMRSVQIKEFIQRVKADKLSVLLSGDYSYAPLSFEEFSYKVVSKYSKALKV